MLNTFLRGVPLKKLCTVFILLSAHLLGYIPLRLADHDASHTNTATAQERWFTYESVSFILSYMCGVRLPWGFTRLAMQCGPHRISHLLGPLSGRVNWKTRPLALCEVVPNELSPHTLNVHSMLLKLFLELQSREVGSQGKLLCTLCRDNFFGLPLLLLLFEHHSSLQCER